MRCRLAVISCLLLGLQPIPADAAFVSASKGEVLINQGQGFMPLGGTVRLDPGSQVMVRNGGEALIYFDGTCSLKLSNNHTFMIGSQPPCPPDRNYVELESRGAEPSEWQTSSSITPSASGGEGPLLGAGGGLTTPVVIGGIVLGGVAIAAIASGGGGGGGGKSRPVSP